MIDCSGDAYLFPREIGPIALGGENDRLSRIIRRVSAQNRTTGQGQGDSLTVLPLAPSEREPWSSFLRTMFRIGLNSFGGPIAQIGVMHKEAVEKHRWLSDSQFSHLLSFANMLPGPEALEIAIHLGYLRRGILGGIVAGLLFIWPGFVSLTALAWIYQRYGTLGPVSDFLHGVRPVAIALVAAAAFRLSRRSLGGGLSYLLMAAAFIASYLLHIPFLLILFACGVLGAFLHRIQSRGSGLRLAGFLFLALVAALVWFTEFRDSKRADPLLTGHVAEKVADPISSPERLREVAWLNTKAALVTFGGAYTALPYLREQVVKRYRWVSDRQVVDALALGETTPGPLISVAIFLSYLAAGFPGAVVGCVFLFLPSFVLVLTLGRHMARVERVPGAQAVLWGFSAGTLGLIVALAASLIRPGLPDWPSVLIAVAAFLAVWRFETNLILVVLVGGLLGLARGFWTS